MALRLRRGTDAERQQITPVEGELIYTTDTKQLWAGDGTTEGGTLVSADAATTLELLTDTDLTGKANDNILAYNSGTAKWQPTDTFNGNVIGDVDGTLTGTVIGDVVGTLNGDMTGSVFGDDSTVLVDGVSSTINAERYRSPTNIVTFGNLEDGVESRVAIDSTNERARLDFIRTAFDDIEGDTALNYGQLTFRRDDVNGEAVVGTIVARENALLFSSSATGSFASPSNYFAFKEQKLGIGTITPTETLDVRGNGVFAGNVEAASFVGSLAADDSSIIVDGIDGSISANSFVQFGSLTTVERDALTAANGMVIYNTTDNKFQGYENGAWVNLI